MLKNENIAYWCVIRNGKLLLQNGSLPLCSSEELICSTETKRFIGDFDSIAVYWLVDESGFSDNDFFNLRELLGCDSRLFALAGRAIQLNYMIQSQRFCCHCGHPLQLDTKVLAMHCSGCESLHYPRVSPCIIVAVRKGNQLLLAQHPRHKTGMYTVIAGFIEPGETAEQCVAREVLEETGIIVKNIRYFDSQPWAFPSNLMLGFIADYAGGDIKPDYEELTDAIWATAEQLPDVAPIGTIARRLIDTVLQLNAEHKTD
ncbi:NAD(+) diphosphatase [Photobacterium aquimaris]|uniref:NAD(+) diphosphatase n=1 Tax=Photobacterium aquimaris TaxID=512643 RepID=A0A2T3HU42_9GAMM|nr:NAD(+) diphosphatase [Photobacterium aquimaris]OBU19950.1 NADH pyrophosphatase [Photobacterium aquimaris]PQJ36859.1 NADH pyrophosphatase [Photobacterium aquimaris]PST99734.1 NAD(+) diphosphatase [Photobacterium aquimaris]